MATLEKALQIAAEAHVGQTDKAGEPYILHPIRVMMGVQGLEGKIAAILHDTVEDTEVTLRQLREAGFSENVVSAVDALTKRDGESRVEAAGRAVKNPIARQVKLSDVTDNMDLSRIPNPTEKDLTRIEEYKAVLKILKAGLDS